MNLVERRIKRYGDARWPDRGVKDNIRKLGEEVFELMVAATSGDDLELALEAADVAIVLVDLLAVKHISLSWCMEVKVGMLETRLALLTSAGVEKINEEF